MIALNDPISDVTEIHSSSTSLNSLNSQLQDDLNEISTWISSNRLSINTNKTVSMMIGPYQKVRNHSLEVSLNGAKICNVSSTKYLGLYIDCHLNWNDHVNYITQRVRAKLAAILRLKPLKPTVLILLYKAFIAPIFDYCDAVWQPSSIKMDRKLDSLYNKAVGMAVFLDSTVRFPSPPSIRRRFHIAVQAYKVLHNFCPPYLKFTLRYTTNVTHRTSKNPHRAFVPYVRTNFAKLSFYFKSVSMWNALPVSLLGNCTSLPQFKRKYKL